jgi:hypothetical protein
MHEFSCTVPADTLGDAVHIGSDDWCASGHRLNQDTHKCATMTWMDKAIQSGQDIRDILTVSGKRQALIKPKSPLKVNQSLHVFSVHVSNEITHDDKSRSRDFPGYQTRHFEKNIVPFHWLDTCNHPYERHLIFDPKFSPNALSISVVIERNVAAVWDTLNAA